MTISEQVKCGTLTWQPLSLAILLYSKLLKKLHPSQMAVGSEISPSMENHNILRKITAEVREGHNFFGITLRYNVS